MEITATPDKIDAFTDMVKNYKITDIARTGITALARGVNHES